MARAVTVMPVRLARRMCLACGFNGRAIQNASRETAWLCPRCGTDLYARPPRSYAELEALSDSNPGTPLDDALLHSARAESLFVRSAARVGNSLRSRHVVVGLAVLTAATLFVLGAWIGSLL
jgi:predicted RNA-binding Zn-ribbon protein involved in translation (DUF1610 family)